MKQSKRLPTSQLAWGQAFGKILERNQAGGSVQSVKRDGMAGLIIRSRIDSA